MTTALTDIVRFLNSYSELTPQAKNDQTVKDQVEYMKTIIEDHLPQGAMTYLGHGIILGEASGDIPWIKKIVHTVKENGNFPQEDLEDLQTIFEEYLPA